jgi:hypothetical protein
MHLTIIKMRGRARAKDAKFFVFKDTREQETLSLDSAQEIEKRVHSFIASRTANAAIKYPLTKSTKPPIPCCDSDSEEVRAVKAGKYSAAHGTVDLHHAKVRERESENQEAGRIIVFLVSPHNPSYPSRWSTAMS